MINTGILLVLQNTVDSIPSEGLALKYTPSEPTEAVKGKKEKVLQPYHEKRADLKDSFSVNQIGSMNFQRYFFPL